MRLVPAICLLAIACGGARPRAAPVVTVTQVGEEPWSVLRYAHVAGTTERVELQLKLRTQTLFENTVLEQGRRDVDFPTIQITGPMTITDVAPDGTARIVLTVEDATLLEDVVDPRQRSALKARAAALRGRVFTSKRAVDGSFVSIDGDAAVAEALTANNVRFPDSPVGVGASWQVTSTAISDGIRWRRTVTYRVRDRSETSVTIDADAELRADEQTLNSEPNATTVLKGGTGRGTSHAVIPLRGLAGEAQADHHLEAELLVTRRHVRVHATVKTDSILSIRSLR